MDAALDRACTWAVSRPRVVAFLICAAIVLVGSMEVPR